jgi:hypothetical protein
VQKLLGREPGDPTGIKWLAAAEHPRDPRRRPVPGQLRCATRSTIPCSKLRIGGGFESLSCYWSVTRGREGNGNLNSGVDRHSIPARPR